jgi:hypothetical protein
LSAPAAIIEPASTAAPTEMSTTGDLTSPNEAPTTEPPKLPETGHAFQEPLPPRELARDAPASRAANLSPSQCLAELRKRNLAVERDTGPASGIAAPVRITGPLRNVRFIAPGRKSVYGKLDCRLALALDELAGVLERHGVVAVRVDNIYRPKARLPGRRARSQHRYGLAMDLMAFDLADGSSLVVEHDWKGTPDGVPCGPDSRLLEVTERAILLRNAVCDVARSGLFHHILTPSYDEAHRDHLHLDIKRGERRSLVE